MGLTDSYTWNLSSSFIAASHGTLLAAAIHHFRHTLLKQKQPHERFTGPAIDMLNFDMPVLVIVVVRWCPCRLLVHSA